MNLLVREKIKSLLAENGMTLTQMAKLLTEKTGKKCTLANLSSKLVRGTLTYNDVVILADALNYNIEFTRKL